MGDGRGGKSAKVVMAEKLVVKHLDAWFYKNHALRDVSLAFEENRVAAIIGPSGCGKSTLVRCLNRMHEVVPGAVATGPLLAGAAGAGTPVWFCLTLSSRPIFSCRREP